MQIIWSDDAKSDFEENIEYLLKEWTEETAIDFIKDVDAILDLLKSNPKLYPNTNYKSIRRAVIRKQITLFYQEKPSSIYLIRLWNNYKDPQSLDL